MEIVSEGIAAVLPNGIRARDGMALEVDALIYGTGFTATDFLAPTQINGLGGRELKAMRKDGAEACLDLTVT